MPGNVLFQTDTEADTDQFVREYVLDAIDRASKIDGCTGITFDRDEQLNPDGDSLVLTVMGDFEPFVDHERDRWNEYQAAGLVSNWEATSFTDEEAAWKFGENGADLATQLLPLGGEMAKLAYEEFEENQFPAPVDSTPQEDGWMPVGWWLVSHHITVGNLGYSPHEEVQMCLATIEEDLRLIAERTGAEAADVKIDEVITTLEGMRAEVKDGRPTPEESSPG